MRRSAAVLAVLAAMAATSFGAAGASAEGVVLVEGHYEPHYVLSGPVPKEISDHGHRWLE